MGKVRKKRARNAFAGGDAVNGAGLAKKTNEMEEEEELLGRENGEAKEELLEKIIRQLQDPCSESQECGLQGFALIVGALDEPSAAGSNDQGPLSLSSVFSHKLVRLVGPLMATQGSPGSVVLSAAGALKNLSLVSAEASEEMVKQDVMTPLCALLKNTFGSADWSPLTKPSAKRDGGVDEKSEIFTEAVGLLWNLCEVSESAVAVFNKENLVDLLMRHVGNEKFELTVKLPVMQCMYTASEDNDEIHEKIRANSDLFQAILSATPGKNDVHADHLYLQMLTVGLVLNSANSSQSEDLPESTWRLIFAIIGKILNLDQRKMACEYTSACPLKRNGEAKQDEEGMEGEGDTGDARRDKLSALRDELNATLLAQQTALEILTNILSRDSDSDEEWEDESESDGAMSDDAVSEASSGGNSVGLAVRDVIQNLSPVITECLSNEEIVQRVLQKANLPPENVCEVLRSGAGRGGKMLTKMLNTLRSRAFLCLHNLVAVLGVEDLGGCELFDTWAGLGKLCLESAATANPDASAAESELQECASSAMRAISSKLAESKEATGSAFAQAVSKEDLCKIFEFGAASTDVSVRINIVNVAGDVGTMLAAVNSDKAEVAAHFLIEAAAREMNLRVVAEALDKTFDMFSEDSTEPLCKKVNAVGRLSGLMPGLKTKIHIKRRELSTEDHALVTMAKTNLVRFIKYKKKRKG